MKYLLITAFALFTFATSIAQNNQDNVEILRDLAAAERKALVAENMMLTDEESKIFWPLYDAYRAEVKDLNTKSIANIERFAENYEKMDDAVAIEIMNNYFKIQTSLVKAQDVHRNKMQKVLPAKLVLRYMQIENKMDAIIDFGVASEIPLIIKE